MDKVATLCEFGAINPGGLLLVGALIGGFALLLLLIGVSMVLAAIWCSPTWL